MQIPNALRIGPRIWKTVAAVAITSIVMTSLFHETPFFGCIGAVVGVGRNREESFDNSIIRNLGTLIGGLVGIAMLSITDNIVIEAFGVIPIILINRWLKKEPSIVPGCIVYFAVVYLMPSHVGILYAFRRISMTFVGTIIGIVINLLFGTDSIEDLEKDSL